MTPLYVDTHELTRRAETRSGVTALAGFERLTASLLQSSGQVAWQLAGRSELAPGGSRRAFLQLTCSVQVELACVRCLAPVPVTLHVERALRLVSTEAQADHEDPDDDEFDVVVGGREFDLGTLIEDELILELPWAPRHETCPEAPRAASAPA